MKITKEQLKQLIKEELAAAMEEGFLSRLFGKKAPPKPDWMHHMKAIEGAYRDRRGMDRSEKIDPEIGKKLGFLADYYLETGETLNSEKGEKMLMKLIRLSRSMGTPRWEKFLSKYSVEAV